MTQSTSSKYIKKCVNKVARKREIVSRKYQEPGSKSLALYAIFAPGSG
jgi:hypothetical protein